MGFPGLGMLTAANNEFGSRWLSFLCFVVCMVMTGERIGTEVLSFNTMAKYQSSYLLVLDKQTGDSGLDLLLFTAMALGSSPAIIPKSMW